MKWQSKMCFCISSKPVLFRLRAESKLELMYTIKFNQRQLLEFNTTETIRITIIRVTKIIRIDSDNLLITIRIVGSI